MENQKKSLGTAANYRGAKNSFVKYLGEVKGFRVTAADIQKWSDGLIADGISKTTVGIYLRACRVIWYACEKLGYVLHSDYPFGKDDDKVSIPKGNTRKNGTQTGVIMLITLLVSSWLNIYVMDSIWQMPPILHITNIIL